MGQHQPLLQLGSAAAIFLLLGQFRYQCALPNFDETTLAYYKYRGSVVWEGVIVDAPLRREQTIDLRVEARRIQIGGEWRQMKGRLWFGCQQ